MEKQESFVRNLEVMKASLDGLEAEIIQVSASLKGIMERATSHGRSRSETLASQPETERTIIQKIAVIQETGEERLIRRIALMMRECEEHAVQQIIRARQEGVENQTRITVQRIDVLEENIRRELHQRIGEAVSEQLAAVKSDVGYLVENSLQ